MKPLFKLLPLLFVLCIVVAGCGYEDDTLVAVKNGEKLKKGSPVRFQLWGIYPDPSQSQAQIEFEVFSPQPIKLSIYSEDWQELRVLSDEIYSPGRHSKSISSKDLANGLYYLVATCADETQILSFVHLE